MGIFSFVNNWKECNLFWKIIQPFVLRLVQKNVPGTVTKLYENLAKHTQPAIDSLFQLKAKVVTTPNELDDYCFNQGITAIENFANYLLEVVRDLKA